MRASISLCSFLSSGDTGRGARQMSHNVKRLPTYCSEEASEQRELAPERRYLQPVHLWLAARPITGWQASEASAAAIV